ncbi:MAG: hypothetical protein AAFR93_05320 [Pseudomonadota bacterium]
MKLFKMKNAFVKDEEGAVTVDWVVLTAALVGIAIGLLAIIRTGLTSASSGIQNVLVAQTPST